MWQSRTLHMKLPYKGKTENQPNRLQPWGRRPLWRIITHERKPSSSTPCRIGQYELWRKTTTGTPDQRELFRFSKCLIRLALIRQNSDANVYISAWKSMTVWCYIHSITKRAEITALVDSGATKNFINLTYTKWLHLPIKKLAQIRKLFNVDGTENWAGELQFYMDLQVRTETTTISLQFFLSDLRDHKAILGYLWFAAVQPRID